MTPAADARTAVPVGRSGAVDGRKDCSGHACAQGVRGLQACGRGPPCGCGRGLFGDGVPVGSAIPVEDGDGDILPP